ncbi:MAG: tryptophan--tRNA ligase [Clostridiales bacterium]|nr:tryptophan--tRNA ligase [Clostridiales bacterium]
MNDASNTTQQLGNVFSAIQPTNIPTIGNYLGALKNWVSLQQDYTCYYAIADLHSLTLCLDGAVLRNNIIDLYALLLACGIDVDRSVFFAQSSVAEHSQLAWVLNCYTQYGQASRMTQFKDKSLRQVDNVNVGLFAYPILQAADILLYNTMHVPIGADQKQHLELTRDIAERFNSRFSPTFVVPNILIPKIGAKINSLQNPTHKMSKSDDNVNAYVLLTDDNDTIVRKIKRAVTDSGDSIEYIDAKPGIANLLSIYSAFENITIQQAVLQFVTKSYAVFKDNVAQCVLSHLQPIRDSYVKLKADKSYIQDCMAKGADRARVIAHKTLSKVYKKIGL